MTHTNLPNPAGSLRKILFLDFDGVLHPAWGNSLPEFVHAHALAQALMGRPCEIVISSTWREHYSLAQLKEFLLPELAGRVIGVLGADQRPPYVRSKNIEVWLDAQSGLVEWRALDDSAAEFQPGCPQLILCDGNTGFGDSQSRELRDWLVSSS
jgi:hypothetical protein